MPSGLTSFIFILQIFRIWKIIRISTEPNNFYLLVWLHESWGNNLIPSSAKSLYLHLASDFKSYFLKKCILHSLLIDPM